MKQILDAKLRLIYGSRLDQALSSLKKRRILTNNHPGLKGLNYRLSTKIQNGFDREFMDSIIFINHLYDNNLQSKDTIPA